MWILLMETPVQTAATALVRERVFACMTSWVEAVCALNCEHMFPISQEDIYAAYNVPFAVRVEEIDPVNYAMFLEPDYVGYFPDSLDDLDEVRDSDFFEEWENAGFDVPPEYREALEWWIVDSSLASWLCKEGEAVLDVGAFHLWGRTTSGQAIAADGVVLAIAKAQGVRNR